MSEVAVQRPAEPPVPPAPAVIGPPAPDRRELVVVRLPERTGWPAARDRVAAYVALTKPRIVELLLVTTLPAMILARGGLPSGWLVAATLVGGALSAGGANAANMYLDRDIDAVMGRTARRPIVTGAVSPKAALRFSVALELAAFGLLAGAVNVLSALLALGAAAFYVGVYTAWLKRSSSQNIVIGGAAGAAPALVGWAAVRGHLDPAAFVLFGLVFLWTPPHFWALAIRYREEYAAVGVPMLPAVRPARRVAAEILAYAAGLVALSFGLAPLAGLGPFYLVSAALLGAVFLGYGLALVREPRPELAMRLFGWSIAYLGGLFLSVGIDVLLRHP